MNIRRTLTAFALLGLLTGCPMPGMDAPTTVSGKITPNGASHPKLAVISFGGDNDDAALAEGQSKISQAKAEGKPLAFTSVIKPQSDGSYTMELKRTQPVTLFYVYAWDDANDNDKVDNGESLTTQAAGGAQAYIYHKTASATKEITADGRMTGLKDSYDWTF